MARAYIEIPLSGEVVAGRVALIDLDDYELVIPHRWFVFERQRVLSMGPYAWANTYRGTKRTGIRMHQLITGRRGIDHQNLNGLDNRRFNLREATRSQQQANTRPRINGTSVYKGVHWRPERGKWQARICKDYRKINLGLFTDEEEAALAYDRAAAELFGEFALLNFP